jgi:hypothetical protein
MAQPAGAIQTGAAVGRVVSLRLDEATWAALTRAAEQLGEPPSRTAAWLLRVMLEAVPPSNDERGPLL